MDSKKAVKEKQNVSFEKIQMVDVKSQYLNIKEEVDIAIQEVIDSCAFINGPAVQSFSRSLENYLGVNHVIPCANGTDALQIAMMALDFQLGDEIIVPAFTYVATAEVIALLGLVPVMVDVDANSFNVTTDIINEAITSKTIAVVPVNLFGQNAELEAIRELCDEHDIWMIEDNAQSIGSDYKMKDGTWRKSGTIGHIGTTSFYPSKNLGAYGDGGAIYTNEEQLAASIKMIANHGQSKRYYHDMIGCNSRLDSMQAAILNVKLKHLDEYNSARQEVADRYDLAFINVSELQVPIRVENSIHVFHQYTLRVLDGSRDELKIYLEEHEIPSMIYYPVPLYKQKAFEKYSEINSLPITELLSDQVISLPMHSEMTQDQVEYITLKVKAFFNA